MKKLFLIPILAAQFFSSKAQISLEQTYVCGVHELGVVNLHLAGQKYARIDYAGGIVNLYHANHSLYKSFNIPNIVCTNKAVKAITDKLFNQNSDIEFLLNCVTQTSNPPSLTYTVFVFDENGQQLFKRDSASFVEVMTGQNPLFNPDAIFNVGLNAKMRLHLQGPSQRFEIYALPGTIPCTDCDFSGMTVTGIQEKRTTDAQKAQFYPNPVSDELKLKYSLPAGVKQGTIKVFSIEGKLIEEFKVTSDFYDILLPSAYNNGLYLYTLEAGGQILKTEKIILSR